MPKHQQLVTSLGATVVMADAENDFLIAEHDEADDAHLDPLVAVTRRPRENKDFGSALKSLLTSTTCHKN
jgi:hypothetical protein